LYPYGTRIVSMDDINHMKWNINTLKVCVHRKCTHHDENTCNEF
jgi:hypothetical protein